MKLSRPVNWIIDKLQTITETRTCLLFQLFTGIFTQDTASGSEGQPWQGNKFTTKRLIQKGKRQKYTLTAIIWTTQQIISWV